MTIAIPKPSGTLSRPITWQQWQEHDQALAESDYLSQARADVDHDTIDHAKISTCPVYRSAVFAQLITLVRGYRAKENTANATPPRVWGGDRNGGNSSWLDDEF